MRQFLRLGGGVPYSVMVVQWCRLTNEEWIPKLFHHDSCKSLRQLLKRTHIKLIRSPFKNQYSPAAQVDRHFAFTRHQASARLHLSVGTEQSCARIAKFGPLHISIKEFASVVLCIPGRERDEKRFAFGAFVNCEAVTAPARGGAARFGR